MLSENIYVLFRLAYVCEGYEGDRLYVRMAFWLCSHWGVTKEWQYWFTSLEVLLTLHLHSLPSSIDDAVPVWPYFRVWSCLHLLLDRLLQVLLINWCNFCHPVSLYRHAWMTYM
jgi:hypothetical protein